jgi:DNA-binding NarL/FixJ family response regulator
MRVLIIDDHPMFRDAGRRCADLDPLAEAVRPAAARCVGLRDESFDLVLLDLDLPDASAIARAPKRGGRFRGDAGWLCQRARTRTIRRAIEPMPRAISRRTRPATERHGWSADGVPASELLTDTGPRRKIIAAAAERPSSASVKS